MSQPQAPAAAEGDAKFQALSRNLMGSLYMLIRSVKLYDPENAIFQKPIHALLETVNGLILKEGRLDLKVVEGNFYVNGKLVQVDQQSLENLRSLAKEMEQRSVGGFQLTKQATPQEIKNFIWIFSKDQKEEAGEEGLSNHRLSAMKLSRWSKLKEKLSDDSSGQIDRKKYAMTVYARMIVWVTATLDALKAGTEPPATSRAARLVQDMVDVCVNHKVQFLGMTATGTAEQLLAFHMANTSLIAIAFASELGLSKPQVKSLALAALFAEAPLWKLPAEVAFALEPELLPKDQQALLQAARREGIRMALAEQGASRQQLLTSLCTDGLGKHFGKPTRDARGRIQLIIPEGDPLLHTRILALCSSYDLLTSSVGTREAYGPGVALDLMWNRWRHHYDPELLGAFLHVMARQPIKVVAQGKGNKGSTVDLAGV
jgi:HD-GYP domain-containing protein (c-di-GMP phosphodiesterase class II)